MHVPDDKPKHKECKFLWCHGHAVKPIFHAAEAFSNQAETESGAVIYDYDPEYVDRKYELLNLKVIHRRGRTGFEETKDFPIRVNDLVAGRYQVKHLPVLCICILQNKHSAMYGDLMHASNSTFVVASMALGPLRCVCMHLCVCVLVLATSMSRAAVDYAQYFSC